MNVFCDFQKTFDASCKVEEDVCRYSFSFPEGAEQYVTLKGKLCSKDCLGQVEFTETERIHLSNSSSKSAAPEQVVGFWWSMELMYRQNEFLKSVSPLRKQHLCDPETRFLLQRFLWWHFA